MQDVTKCPYCRANITYESTLVGSTSHQNSNYQHTEPICDQWHVIQNGLRDSITGGEVIKECCQCHSKKAVINKYNPTDNAPIPIGWVCCICKRNVCFNCALILPGSNPIEFYDLTLCSNECWLMAGSPPE